MTRYVIWGAGGHAREVNLLCEVLGYPVLGFLDERPEEKGNFVDGKPVLGDLTDILNLRQDVIIICAGVGDPTLRQKFVSKSRELGFSISESLIHPSVSLPNTSSIGEGCVIFAGTQITTNVHIGDFVVINLGCTLSHDSMIDDFATISPGVNICGNVHIGEGAYIGVGTSIREKTEIGAWSMIGGGSFVRTNVPSRCLYAGVPARLIKSDYGLK